MRRPVSRSDAHKHWVFRLVVTDEVIMTTVVFAKVVAVRAFVPMAHVTVQLLGC